MPYCSKHLNLKLAKDGSCSACWILEEVRSEDEPKPAPKPQPAPAPAPVVMQPHRDITSRRHKGNQFSVAANPTVSQKSQDMESIYREFVRRGADGAVREDVYLSLGFHPNTGSARCADLKHAGRIVPVWNPDGSHKRGKTMQGKGAGIMCADIHGEPRPIQTASSTADAMAAGE